MLVDARNVTVSLPMLMDLMDHPTPAKRPGDDLCEHVCTTLYFCANEPFKATTILPNLSTSGKAEESHTPT